MQCRLLLSSTEKEGTAVAVEELIGGLADGQSPHCYEAFNLVFKMAIESKRKKLDRNSGIDLQESLKWESADCLSSPSPRPGTL